MERRGTGPRNPAAVVCTRCAITAPTPRYVSEQPLALCVYVRHSAGTPGVDLHPVGAFDLVPVLSLCPQDANRMSAEFARRSRVSG